MNFWDSSAVIPLLLGEKTTRSVREILAVNREMYVWWGTEIECVSTIARLEREGVAPRVIASALERLTGLSEDWSEITPGPLVRDTARRLLRVHPLRAADALQLAAATVLADQRPASVTIVTLDAWLRNAATREGFQLAPAAI